MPLYDFKCTSCGHEFEELVSSSEIDEVKCPKCSKASVEKKVSASSVQANEETADRYRSLDCSFYRGG